MRVFYHHIYEYTKGLRNLILYTSHIVSRGEIENKLQKIGISYVIYSIGKNKINVFFGHEACVNVIKQINKSNLTEYTEEEDFIIGTMLGYDRLKQCERYLKRKKTDNSVTVSLQKCRLNVNRQTA